MQKSTQSQTMIRLEAVTKVFYADQLETQIRSQDEEMKTNDGQLREVETTAREVVPLMQKMLDTLEQFVGLDVPFLLEERTKRMATLKELMTRADVAFSEKYRRILEAYQVEMEYGRTIETDHGPKRGYELLDRTVQQAIRQLRHLSVLLEDLGLRSDE